MAVLEATGTLAALSYHFGLKKSDVLELTPVGLESYLSALDDINRDSRRG